MYPKSATLFFHGGKYSYLKVPMGIASSPDIFQAKMSKLMVALEFVRTYLDDLLFITKASLDDHHDHLRLVFTRLQEVGLKINAPKSKFCAEETEYLWCILTLTGIKPQPKKVQAIFTTSTPKTVKDLCSFLGMVQYYQDLWSRCSEMLAPFTSLVGECGITKDTKAKKTETGMTLGYSTSNRI